jgi:hypothetical protein
MHRIRTAAALVAAFSLALGAAEAQRTKGERGRKPPGWQRPKQPTPDETAKALAAFKIRVDQ